MHDSLGEGCAVLCPAACWQCQIIVHKLCCFCQAYCTAVLWQAKLVSFRKRVSRVYLATGYSLLVEHIQLFHQCLSSLQASSNMDGADAHPVEAEQSTPSTSAPSAAPGLTQRLRELTLADRP